MKRNVKPEKKLQNLVDLAQAIKFDSHKPLRYYVVLVNELEHRGKRAIMDRRFEEAFVNLVRMLLVIISYIPKHPDYQIIDPKIYAEMTTLKERYFSITSKVKHLLRKTYENEYEIEKHENECRERQLLDKETTKQDSNNFFIYESENELIQLNEEDTFDGNLNKEYDFVHYSPTLSYQSIANQFYSSSPSSKTFINHPDNSISYKEINSNVSTTSYKDLIPHFDQFNINTTSYNNNINYKTISSSSSSSSSSIESNINGKNDFNTQNTLHSYRNDSCNNVQYNSKDIILKKEYNHENTLSVNSLSPISSRNSNKNITIDNNSISSILPDLEDFSSPKSKQHSNNNNNNSQPSINNQIHNDSLNNLLDQDNYSTTCKLFDRSLKPTIYNTHIVTTNSNNNTSSSIIDDINVSIDSPHEVTTTTIFDDTESDFSIKNNISVLVPSDTVEQFNYYAMNDIKQNIETLGILAGIYLDNNYLITHIILPKQEGTPDSCEMLNENEIFLYQIENNLLTLGWIHTHPTQSCFLSSVDLHTHYSYQCQLEHAVAIVVSHKKNCNYTFNLTSHGMEEIKNCDKRGFHPHGSNIFQVCPFAVSDNSKSIKVVDMRK